MYLKKGVLNERRKIMGYRDNSLIGWESKFSPMAWQVVV